MITHQIPTSLRPGSDHFRQLTYHRHGKSSVADSMSYGTHMAVCPINTVRMWDWGVRFRHERCANETHHIPWKEPAEWRPGHARARKDRNFSTCAGGGNCSIPTIAIPRPNALRASELPRTIRIALIINELTSILSMAARVRLKTRGWGLGAGTGTENPSPTPSTRITPESET